MIHNLLFVMLGGALGAALRYGVGCLVGTYCPHLCDGVLGGRLAGFPLATFVVNVAGCFLLGVLTAIGEQHAQVPRHVMLMLTVGLCGAFTTFSTFTSETVKALEGGQTLLAALYVGVSVVVGFLLFWWGKGLVASLSA